MKIAVVLSGCGFKDGAEINESVFTLLSLSLEGVDYQCFAPDILQTQVIDHLSGKVMPESRNILIEAARIARGKIKPLSEADANDYAGVIFPGGFGAATNLCDFASNGANMQVNAEVIQFAKQFIATKKPLGLLCIAPVLAPKICDNAIVTVGNDENVVAAINIMGGQHEECEVTEYVHDKANNIVSTPAFMLSENLTEVFTGIKACVDKVIQLARKVQ